MILKPRGDFTGSANRGISGPTERTYVLQNLNKKKKRKKEVHCLQCIFCASYLVVP